MNQELEPLPSGPLLSFYGDDFTGSSAAMEAFAWQGIKTVLFLDVPSAERLAEFSEYRCIGVAGIARSKSPVWMDAQLPAIFERLAQTGSPIVHYKVCSTFDSSPQIGSIGKAAELGAELFPGPIPMLVGDLGMGRIQVFGHLFAQANGQYYRLDRHPTMASHPSTPMHESDLARHLASQTNLPVSNIDFLKLKAGDQTETIGQASPEKPHIYSIDLVDAETLVSAGKVIWAGGRGQKFVIGSQGVQAALAAYWRSEGLLTDPLIETSVQAVNRIAVVSGSVSPMTAAQIDHATSHGFEAIRLDLGRVSDQIEWNAEVDLAVSRSKAALSEGRDPLVFTAKGPDDPAVSQFKEKFYHDRMTAEAANDLIGSSLGQILDRLIIETGLSRIVLSGGDTSSHAALRLKIDALTSVAKLSPGGPLCRAHSADPSRNGIEIAMKGGQVGSVGYFTAARDGQ
ncbi:four-carbon acid sugar kinase family protein [Agrobacterium larrymoorei]|uniref:four-carbon acid sugar kinase family protein n=1 Tax=Rhizobium/Agrobacterium group TaxID=227290 RepID=UPI001440EDA6|nr:MULTISPECIES: four-carbon acid sugar kinase family protein [Rhizobium/Agrobacterium group]NKM57741.1 four-carbon acid sugar kinase family protein [Rhizobium anhuiense]NTJ44955.1 four-carbon acid sugar kinase family protein [Agrobacterium larrymoorei]